MKYAVFFCIGHANSELARSIGLPCAADIPILHMGYKEPALLTFLRENLLYPASCSISGDARGNLLKKVVISPHLETLFLFCLYTVIVKISLGIHGAQCNRGVLLRHEVKQQLLGGMARAHVVDYILAFYCVVL